MSKEQEVKHTPTPWRVRYFPDNKDCFVQADRTKPEHRYDIEIIGEDTGGDYYPYEQKEADCHFIVTACNSHYSLKKENEELRQAVREMGELLSEMARYKREKINYHKNMSEEFIGHGDTIRRLESEMLRIVKVLTKAGITVSRSSRNSKRSLR